MSLPDDARKVFESVHSNSTINQIAADTGLTSLVVTKICSQVEDKGLISTDESGRVQWTFRGTGWWSKIVREGERMGDDETFVLTDMEKHESELVDIGLFDVVTTVDELAQRLGRTTEELSKIVEGLAESRMVLRLLDKEGHVIGYRSRTAEICRLIYLVRQRLPFHRMINQSGRLVSSLKWVVEDRTRLERTVPVDALLQDIKTIVRLAGYERDWKNVEQAFTHLSGRTGITSLSSFQFKAAKQIALKLRELDTGKNETTTILVAPTGQGKTEAYFIPVLSYALARRAVKGKNIKLVCLYPRQDLSINQFERFTKYAYYLNEKLDREWRVGLDNRTVSQSFGGWQSYNRNDYEDAGSNRIRYKHANCPVEDDYLGFRFACRAKFQISSTGECACQDGHELPSALIKEQIYQGKDRADLLIITPGALSVKLTQEQFTKYLADSSTDIVVLAIDEIHLLYGLYGSSVSAVIRRFEQECRALGIKLFLIGLSATITSPEYFFETLTGKTVKPEDVINPAEEEQTVDGVEHYFFVKPETTTIIQELRTGRDEARFVAPLSTVIQTIMTVLHNAYRPQLKHRGLCFIDSIDIVHRLSNQLGEAENNPTRGRLFDIRSPTRPNNQACCNERGAIKGCNSFEEGDCWWFMGFDRKSELRNGFSIKSHYAEKSEREIKEDLVISTSALEVGFDDPSLLYMFQYGTPPSVASFMQRKGRVGREPGDRPIITLILSPYKPRDMFYFINHDLVASGQLLEVPLSPDNWYVEKEAWRAAILDCMNWFYTTRSKATFAPFHILSEASTPNLVAIHEFLKTHRDMVDDWLKRTSKLYHDLPEETRRFVITNTLQDLEEALSVRGVTI